MKYDFDTIIPRENTDCVKYDLRNKFFKTEDVIPMWVADMDFATPDFILKAIQDRLKHPILAYSYRSENYHQSIESWLKKQYNWHIESSWISFSPGVVPGIVTAIQALTKPKDKIIVQTPVYFPFFSSIKGTNREMLVNELTLVDGKYQMNFDDLENQIDSNTKMLILCNPHNPVGRAWSKEELARLADICEKHKLIVLSDEIHSDLVFKPYKHIPFASISAYSKNKTITFMAPSKTFNIAGLSTSFVIIPNPSLQRRYTRGLEIYHLNLGNIFGTLATTAAFQYGAEWKDQLKQYLMENINQVKTYFKSNLPKIQLIENQATYLLWLDCRALELDDTALSQFFTQEAKLGLNPGNMFGQGGSGFMRMNIAMPRSVIEKVLINLKKAYQERNF